MLNYPWLKIHKSEESDDLHAWRKLGKENKDILD